MNVNLVTLRFETLLVQNCMFHISCIITFLFIIVPVLELRVHHLYLFSNQAFNFVFENVAFTRITMCTEQEISFRIIATSSRYLLRKMWIEVLWILHFVVYFSSEAMLKGLSKYSPTEKQIDAEIQMAMKYAPVWRRTVEKTF